MRRQASDAVSLQSGSSGRSNKSNKTSKNKINKSEIDVVPQLLGLGLSSENSRYKRRTPNAFNKSTNDADSDSDADDFSKVKDVNYDSNISCNTPDVFCNVSNLMKLFWFTSTDTTSKANNRNDSNNTMKVDSSLISTFSLSSPPVDTTKIDDDAHIELSEAERKKRLDQDFSKWLETKDIGAKKTKKKDTTDDNDKKASVYSLSVGEVTDEIPLEKFKSIAKIEENRAKAIATIRARERAEAEREKNRQNLYGTRTFETSPATTSSVNATTTTNSTSISTTTSSSIIDAIEVTRKNIEAEMQYKREQEERFHAAISEEVVTPDEPEIVPKEKEQTGLIASFTALVYHEDKKDEDPKVAVKQIEESEYHSFEHLLGTDGLEGVVFLPTKDNRLKGKPGVIKSEKQSRTVTCTINTSKEKKRLKFECDEVIAIHKGIFSTSTHDGIKDDNTITFQIRNKPSLVFEVDSPDFRDFTYMALQLLMKRRMSDDNLVMNNSVSNVTLHRNHLPVNHDNPEKKLMFISDWFEFRRNKLLASCHLMAFVVTFDWKILLLRPPVKSVDKLPESQQHMPTYLKQFLVGRCKLPLLLLHYTVALTRTCSIGNINYIVGADSEGYTHDDTIPIRAIESIEMINSNTFQCEIAEQGSATFKYFVQQSCDEVFKYLDGIIEKMKV